MKKKLVILASGSGSNAENIVDFYAENEAVEVLSIATNKKDAGVIARAEKLDVPVLVFSKDELQNPSKFTALMKKLNPDLIILAGFLLQVPDHLIEAFAHKIINIHPALLPNFGGKGMFGMNVHKAVKKAGDSFSGITIHYVNEKYDDGEIIFQAKTPISENDQPVDIANKIHVLEHEHFPKVIDSILNK
ncbi:MAG: phosphoribosylglycinamide formyltransferase [Flavobacteriales bacterium]